MLGDSRQVLDSQARVEYSIILAFLKNICIIGRLEPGHVRVNKNVLYQGISGWNHIVLKNVLSGYIRVEPY